MEDIVEMIVNMPIELAIVGSILALIAAVRVFVFRPLKRAINMAVYACVFSTGSAGVLSIIGKTAASLG